ncbi:MAG: DUF4097 domain-containing protein [Alphaproteobacteria bacterium]|nr:DUF4097 domain-containing protein [Alphaproteobacteria bacterium]
MQRAWLAAGVVTAALMTSGCVIVVADDDAAKMHFDGHRQDGFIVLDRNGDYSRIGGDTNLRGFVGGDVSLISGDVEMDEITIQGDLSIAAGDVDFTGRVEGEASIAGGDVTWDGEAGDELSIAAGELMVRGRVEGEGSFAAASMHIESEIDGRLVAQADDMYVAGRVNNRIKLIAADEIRRSRRDEPDHGRIELNGYVADGGEVCTRTLIVGPDAQINGVLEVWAEEAPQVNSAARVADLRFNPRDGRDCDRYID